MKYFIHHTADVDASARIGKDTKIWHLTQIRENVRIGDNCVVGKNVYIDTGVTIGNACKIQNNSSLYRGLTVGDGVFIGPHVVFTNDKYPEAVNPDGTIKTEKDWSVGRTIVKKGASIGAGAIMLPGIVIGSNAVIGAGSVVTKNVPDGAVVFGNPAKIIRRR